MEKYIPIEILGMFEYTIHHVVITGEKMTAYIVRKFDHQQSYLLVVDACLASRVLDEGKRLRLLRDHQLGGNQIFECMQSDFINWFRKENLGMYSDDEMHLRHFLISDDNYMIDVITALTPSLRKLDHNSTED